MASKYRSRGTNTDFMWVVDAIFKEVVDDKTLSVLNKGRIAQGLEPIEAVSQMTVNLQTDDPFDYPHRMEIMVKNKATTGYYTPQNIVTDVLKAHKCRVVNFVGGTEFAEETSKFGKALQSLPKNSVLFGDVFSVEYINKSRLSKITESVDDYKSRCTFRFYVAGSSSREYLRNIKFRVNMNDVYSNIEALLEFGVNFYIIFTGMSVKEIRNFKMNLKKEFGEERATRILEDAISLEVDISEVDSGLSVK